MVTSSTENLVGTRALSEILYHADPSKRHLPAFDRRPILLAYGTAHETQT